jgi:hypothetical protein
MPIGCWPYTCHPTGCEADGPALASRGAEHVAPKETGTTWGRRGCRRLGHTWLPAGGPAPKGRAPIGVSGLRTPRAPERRAARPPPPRWRRHQASADDRRDRRCSTRWGDHPSAARLGAARWLRRASTRVLRAAARPVQTGYVFNTWGLPMIRLDDDLAADRHTPPPPTPSSTPHPPRCIG